MTPADVRLTAQLVAAGRVFSITDASLMALARRVLELEADDDAVLHAAIGLAQRTEREACAKLAEDWPTLNSYGERIAAAIRARGAK